MDGNRFDTVGRRIVSSVRSELALESEVLVAVGVEADVREPHAFVRLDDGAEGVLNCARSNGFAAGCNSSITIPNCKNLEVRYRIVT